MAAAGTGFPGAADFRVLAFEDTYDMANILRNAGVQYGHLEQRWTTTCAPPRGVVALFAWRASP